jgi:hypothetical protein
MKSIAVAFWVICAVATAQPRPTPSPAEATETKAVSELLSSGDAAQLAWGAHLAANYQLKSFAPDILRLAVSDNWGIRMTAIDSIIRMELDVPEETLTRIADRNIDAALIILARTRARSPDAYSRLAADLLTRDFQQNDVWVALNSILQSKPPAGFAARLIEDWTIHTRVAVTDPGEGAGGGMGGGTVGCGASSELPGFPPLFAYAVRESPTPGDVVLAGGPHPVGYRRQDPSSRSDTTIDREEYRWDYLASLAGMDQSNARSIWFGTLSQPGIWWKNDTQYRADALELRQKIQRTIAGLRSELVRRQLLTSEESATVNPRFDVTVGDLRKRPARPLLEIRWTLAGGQQQ